ncbi:TrkH family potassium uptake protein [Bacillus benzoevorans]|uniref:Trk-type K+ transport system membrane component n=1 Tax=Bacillus benzoevorans TaxID=1456 RepID=A0A7X0LTP8_9BACI|nr:TrkH family potassium uptake protein [Bacillus benzoevorans]MBB6443635.1 Trk-type K+ transport system membrane component [Bacillus benzoevorans]
MLKKLKVKLDNITPAQAILSFYFIAVTVSVLLLSIPAVHQEGVKVSLMDTIFTAISSVSVTGLSVINISETYSVFGIFVLMFVFQFGGIGVMSLGTFFWLIFGKKIGLRGRQLIMVDHNQTSLSGLVALIIEILKMILLIEFVGALVLGFHFLQYYPTFWEAMLNGLFMSVSATTNAGLDITGASLMPFANDYFVQLINIILLTLGAIGFPVLIEVKNYLFHKEESSLPFRFSLFTKITTIMFAGLLIIGTLLILLLEFQHFFKGMVWHKSLFYAFFQSATTRSGGLATMDVSEFTSPTLLVISLLMFIGASPSSVGGGIRTTTLALNILFLYHFARGRKDIKIFRREIHETDILKSLAVTILAVIICFTAVVILSITEEHSLLEIIFEVCSAFGTTGLSMGITADLSFLGKWVIMLLMFIGRIGLVSLLLLLRGRGPDNEVNYHYPKENLIIG